MAFEFNRIPLLSSDGMLQAAWHKLMRLLEVDVEHKLIQNNSGGELTRGQIVRMNGDRQVQAARGGAADAQADAEWTGVIVDATLADQAQGPMATDNVRLVRFESGLTPAAGEAVYLSATEAGSATNVAPSASNEWVIKIGLVADASPYVTVDNPFAWVLLNNCCEPA